MGPRIRRPVPLPPRVHGPAATQAGEGPGSPAAAADRNGRGLSTEDGLSRAKPPGPGLRERLLAWYRRNRRDLPWRRTKDPYRIWVSEVMLQQTTVRAVRPYYEAFVERFPTVQALASADEEHVLAAWSGLGYYHRARNLRRGARHVVAKHDGRVPKSLEA